MRRPSHVANFGLTMHYRRQSWAAGWCSSHPRFEAFLTHAFGALDFLEKDRFRLDRALRDAHGTQLAEDLLQESRARCPRGVLRAEILSVQFGDENRLRLVGAERYRRFAG